MRIAFSKPHRDEAELERLLGGFRSAGYEGLQLKIGQFRPWVRDPVAFRERWGEDTGAVSALIFFGGLDEQGRSDLDATLAFAAATGAERVVFCHDHGREGVDREVLRGFARELDAYAVRAADAGVAFSLHHHTGHPVMLPEDVEVFFEATGPAMRLTVDTAHLVRSGVDDVPGFLRAYGGLVDNIHLKDVDDDRWRLLGEGRLDLDAILSELRRQDYRSWLCVDEESDATLEEGLASSRAWLDEHLPASINDEGDTHARTS